MKKCIPRHCRSSDDTVGRVIRGYGAGMPSSKAKRFRANGELSPGFKRAVRAIHDELERHSSSITSARRSGVPMLNRQSSRVKLAAYDLAHCFRSREKRRHLEVYIASRLGRRTPQTPISVNIYKWLVALLVDEFDLPERRQITTRWADELLYAERHRIPAHLLIGFIAQAGGSERISCELASNRTEPWLGAHLQWLEDPTKGLFPSAI